MSNIYENDMFTITVIDDAIGEDGVYGRNGYAVTNKDTGVIEVTGLVLAQLVFFADQSEGMLKTIGEDQSDASALVAAPEDVTVN